MHPTPRMHIHKNRYAFAKFFLSLALSFTLLLSMTSLMLARSGVARDAITITSQTQQVHFPDSIDFSLTANDAGGKITQAVLTIQAAPSLRSDEIHFVTVQHPDASVHLSWREDMQKANDFFTPGTPISYHWEIEDNAGADHTGTTQKFDIDDQRFAWQETDVQQFQIKYYNSDDAEVQALRAGVDKAVKRLTSNLGGAPTKPITLWIYKDANAFKSALPPDTYEWVGGIAFPDIHQGMFVVTDAQDNTLIRDMPHEMSHLVLHELTDGGISIPRWLDEGLAVYNQEYHEGELSYQLRQALKNHQILRLSEIEDRFPSDSNQAYLAYAQSWDLVTYMYNTFGQAKMHTLVKYMGNSSNLNFDEDLKASLGLDEAHLENAWRLSQHQSSILTPDQEKQDPQPTKQVVAPSSNNPVPYSTLLLALGIFLLVSPGFAFAGYFVYRRQERIQQERKLAIAQAQRILDEAHWGPGPQSFTPIDPYDHYTNPGRYTQPGGMIPPFSPPGSPQSGAGEQFGSFIEEK